MDAIDGALCGLRLPFRPDAAALVTGGSRGIGRAIVLELASQGVRTAFTYNTQEHEAKETERLAAVEGHDVRGVSLQLEDAENVREVLATIGKEMDGFDVLVNNAGIRDDHQFALTSAANWDRVMDVNLRGAFLATKTVFRSMCRRRYGSIVNVSSITATRPLHGQVSYASSKAGMIAMTKVLAKEGAGHAVRANVVLPGLIRTDMTRDVAELGADFVPLGRAGSGGDVARAVTFLASDAAEYITGAELIVDGGLSV